MRIGVDIDEVLVDFLSAFLDDHNNRYGTNYRREDFFSFGMHHVMHEDDEVIHQRISNFERSEEYRSMMPIPGAVEGLRALSQDHDLIIVSSRSDQIHDHTRLWLSQNFPGMIKEVHFSSHPYTKRGSVHTKADLCTLVKLDVLIEDAMEHILPCAERGIKVLVFDTPWNREPNLPQNVTRVHSWPEIVDVIRQNKI